MKKITAYQKALMQHNNMESFLRSNSCLPGVRANLELLYAFAEVSETDTVLSLLNRQYPELPVNNPEEFITCCAVAACGKQIVNGHAMLKERLRTYASDSRWRIRESVAMALQYIGKHKYEELMVITEDWARGNYYEQRAVIAGLCEPVNLNNEEIKIFTLNMLDKITRNVIQPDETKSSSFTTLVQALCYCWSVAIAASPENGKVIFEKLTGTDNKIIRKIVRENLKKNRLIKMDNEWVVRLFQKI